MNPGSPPTSDGRGPRPGCHGARATTLGGRGSRRNMVPTIPRHWFEGATDELKGQIFDLVGVHSADIFIKSKKALANYVG